MLVLRFSGTREMEGLMAQITEGGVDGGMVRIGSRFSRYRRSRCSRKTEGEDRAEEQD